MVGRSLKQPLLALNSSLEYLVMLAGLFCVLRYDQDIVFISTVVNNRAQGINPPFTINNKFDLKCKVKTRQTITLLNGPPTM